MRSTARSSRRTTALTALLGLAAFAAVVVPSAVSPAAVRVASYGDVAAAELRTPALVTSAPGVVEAYLRGADGSVRQQVRQAGAAWSVEQVLGGRVTSRLAAASRGDGRVDLFARGGQGQLLQRYRANGRWSAWTHLGGRLVGAPAAAWSAPGRLDVVVRGTDGQLYARHHSGGRWSGWRRVGGALASSPAAASTGDGRLDVVVRGTNGEAYRTTSVAGVWAPWVRLGGRLHSEPAAVRADDGRLHVVVRGSSGALHHGTVAPTGAWSGWALLPGAVGSGPGATATPDGLALGARDGAGRFVTRDWDGAWSSWTGVDALRPFRGLGAWVDLYDYQLAGASLQPGPALDDLRARGVRTVWLQTSRFSVGFDMASQAGAWVDAAHARGMAVVGWYLPGYGDMARDLRRTLAIGALRTRSGGGFDAIGVDIEAHTGWGSNNEVPRTTMNARAVDHLRSVRARTSLPLSAITPQPTATDGAGETWAGFPWKGVGEHSDVVVPMSYWPAGCRDRCVHDYTLTNSRYAGAWSGRPVHIVGRGYPSGAGPVSDSDIRAFVDGAVAARPIGGSLYDYASTRTRTSWWPQQQRLNRL